MRPCQPPNGPKPGWLKAWPAKNAVVPTPSARTRPSRAARPRRRRAGAGVPGFVTFSVIDGSIGQWDSPDRHIQRQLFWPLLRRVKICKAGQAGTASSAHQRRAPLARIAILLARVNAAGLDPCCPFTLLAVCGFTTAPKLPD